MIVPVCVLLLVSPAAGAGEAQPPFYETAVQKLFQSKCIECHDSATKEAGLDLSTPRGILRGSDSGRVVLAGDAKGSQLLEMIESGEMPPDKQDRLTQEQVEIVRHWIAGGARVRDTTRIGPDVTGDDVIPLLYLRCVVCHGEREQKGGLDLRTRESILKGGKSGPACVSGDPAASLIVQRVHSGEMPPKRELVNVSVKPMPESELNKLRRWIELGLPETPADEQLADPGDTVSDEDRAFWAFQPPVRPAVPRVQSMDQIANPIDAFILQKLEQHGLTLTGEAESGTLLRRVSFDLTGLPPTPAELDQFLHDDRPDAYAIAVDRLLNSPRYGERWGRHWLDAAGYADSEGAQNQDRVRHHMYRYRDYVIRSFNADKPYSQFLIEQLAGDELACYSDREAVTPEIYDNLVATGFLRTAPDRTFAGITNFVPDRLEVIADEMDILGSAVMGLTLKCARCHSHKFDPIPQRDYYRLTAIFKDALDEHDWLSSDGGRSLPHVLPEERRAFEQRIRQIDQQLATLRSELGQAADDAKPAIEERIRQVEAERPREPSIRALWSRGAPSPTWILKRGDYQTPGRAVGPGVPVVLASGKDPDPLSRLISQAAADGATQTGLPTVSPTYRRLAFARWLTQPDHPLTARVMVNRIWMHHFGRGLVTTPANFGKAGQPPTHPELLDWLAREFVETGWSMKSMHRLMVTSRTYRQSSFASAAAFERDADGRLYSRGQAKRLEAEAIRDTLLYVSGRLDERRYGPADEVDVREDGLVTSRPTGNSWRRSIYVLQRRTQVPTLLDSFDFPQMGPNCIQRNQSLVATQALHMMNDSLVHRLSSDFADRMLAEGRSDVSALVTRVYRHAFSRSPDAAELAAGLTALEELSRRWQAAHPVLSAEAVLQKATASYCHAVFNLAEFVHVE